MSPVRKANRAGTVRSAAKIPDRTFAATETRNAGPKSGLKSKSKSTSTSQSTRRSGKPAKAALVTGSAKRLGREMALRLASEGYFTFVHYLASRSEAQKVLAEIENRGGQGAIVKGDMASRRDIATLADKIKAVAGRLDVLVNNVGIYRTGDLLGYPVEDFETTLQANLIGPFHLIQRLSSLLPRGGSIVNIGYSGVETLTGSTHNTAYLISKSGLLILTKSMAQALGPRGVRVNMISPGILDNSVELPERPGETIPLARLGACSDVCDALSFLIGDRAGYITGTNLDVAGGYMLGLKELDVERGPSARGADGEG